MAASWIASMSNKKWLHQNIKAQNHGANTSDLKRCMPQLFYKMNDLCPFHFIPMLGTWWKSCDRETDKQTDSQGDRRSGRQTSMFHVYHNKWNEQFQSVKLIAWKYVNELLRKQSLSAAKVRGPGYWWQVTAATTEVACSEPTKGIKLGAQTNELFLKPTWYMCVILVFLSAVSVGFC